ncbi:MAG: ABC transporter ATP-binding protein [Proteobacteria bacterium]|nr:ABC transporter ATP-binding protein [Pseudomonadota bacterium]
MAASAVLELNGVCKSFEQAVLRDLSFSIYPGETVALVGANGAGKSTLIKMILGLARATQGEIKLWGEAHPNFNSFDRIGYLPELASFWNELSAWEFLEAMASLRGRFPASESRISNLLELFGLKNRARKKMGTFSKGMLQRTALANLLLDDPDFLILDEPMSGLDPRAQGKLRNILAMLRARGKTMLISSHSLEDIEKLCTRVIVLEKTYKVLDGPSKTVLPDLQEKYQNSEPWDEDPLGDENVLL